jgi:outer membrane biogenesis lipoprotein LolB
MFSSEDWLEVLPVYTQAYEINSKNYSQEYDLTKGNWILYFEGYQQLMIYEITITKG